MKKNIPLIEDKETLRKKINERIRQNIDSSGRISNAFIKEKVFFNVEEKIKNYHSGLNERAISMLTDIYNASKKIYAEEIIKINKDIKLRDNISEYNNVFLSYGMSLVSNADNSYLYILNNKILSFIKIETNNGVVESCYMGFYIKKSDKKPDLINVLNFDNCILLKNVGRSDVSFAIYNIGEMTSFYIDEFLMNQNIANNIYSSDILEFGFININQFKESNIKNEKGLFSKIISLESDDYYEYFLKNNNYYRMDFFKYKNFISELSNDEKKEIFYRDIIFNNKTYLLSENLKNKCKENELDPNLIPMYYSLNYKKSVDFDSNQLKDVIDSLNEEEISIILNDDKNINYFLFKEYLVANKNTKKLKKLN